MKLFLFLPFCVIASRLDRFFQYHSRKLLKKSNKASLPQLMRLLQEEQIILGLSNRSKSVPNVAVMSANARRNQKYSALNYRSKSFKGKYDLDFGTNALSSYFN